MSKPASGATINVATVLPSTVFLVPFLEGSGSAVKELVSGTSYSISGTPSWGTGAFSETALNFDGAANYIPTFHSTLGAAWTVACRFHRGSSAAMGLAGQNDSGVGTVNFYHRVGNTSGFTSGGSYKEVGTGSDVANGADGTSVVTYDGATLKIYINATLQSSLSFSGTPDNPSSSPITVGRTGDYAGGQYFQGAMSLYQVATAAWSSGQVSAWDADPWSQLQAPAAAPAPLLALLGCG